MRRFEHGGNIYAHEGVVDFSANLNPLGMPQIARDALSGGVERFEAYPDPKCAELTHAIARFFEVGESQVICTAGATDLIERIVRVSQANTALIVVPCYSGYEQALIQHGTHIAICALRDEDDFALTDDFLQSMTDDISLVFIANPNNPTGLTIASDVLEAVLARAADIDARVVLDECFIEFTDASSMVGRIHEHPQLIVMRAFTKTYAMAGLRLGYGICADESFVRELHEAGQPWAVSTPAQVAGLAALRATGFVEESRAYVAQERAWLKTELGCLGLRVIDGKANYLMFRCERALYEPLLECGLLIRCCDNYIGLDSSWYRVAVRTHSENARLIDAMRGVLA